MQPRSVGLRYFRSLHELIDTIEGHSASEDTEEAEHTEYRLVEEERAGKGGGRGVKDANEAGEGVTDIHTYVCIYIHTYVYTYIHIYIYIYMVTYIHTQI